jgi:hypothetical protein
MADPNPISSQFAGMSSRWAESSLWFFYANVSPLYGILSRALAVSLAVCVFAILGWGAPGVICVALRVMRP